MQNLLDIHPEINFTGWGGVIIKEDTMSRIALFMPKLNGMGHVTRCLKIAQEMSDRGWKCLFDVAGPNEKLIFESGFQTITNTSHKSNDLRTRASQQVPPYVLCHKPVEYNSNIASKLEQIKATLNAVDEIKPSVIICDMDWRARIIGEKLGIPTIGIIQQQWYPGNEHQWNCWWYDIPPLFMDESKEIENYNMICNWLNVSQINKFNEQWSADLLLVPSIPEIDQIILDEKYPVYYIGPIIHNWNRGSNQELLKWMQSHEGNLIFSSNGGTYFDNEVTDLIISAAAKKNIPLLMALGPQSSNFRKSKSVSSCKIVEFVDWRMTKGIASINIHHGGHGSTMAAILAGQPSIVIPFQMEQEIQARMVIVDPRN